MRGAILTAAGVGLEEACQTLPPCPTGEARITPGFKLPGKYIIHAVGPVWHGDSRREPELLASANRSALKLAGEQGCQRIAFPAIGTGIFGYLLQAATDIAIKNGPRELCLPKHAYKGHLQVLQRRSARVLPVSRIGL